MENIKDLVKKNELKHIAIIMDGNRRWAKEHFLPSMMGHKKGVGDVVNGRYQHTGHRRDGQRIHQLGDRRFGHADILLLIGYLCHGQKISFASRGSCRTWRKKSQLFRASVSS